MSYSPQEWYVYISHYANRYSIALMTQKGINISKLLDDLDAYITSITKTDKTNVPVLMNDNRHIYTVPESVARVAGKKVMNGVELSALLFACYGVLYADEPDPEISPIVETVLKWDLLNYVGQGSICH